MPKFDGGIFYNADGCCHFRVLEEGEPRKTGWQWIDPFWQEGDDGNPYYTCVAILRNAETHTAMHAYNMVRGLLWAMPSPPTVEAVEYALHYVYWPQDIYPTTDWYAAHAEELIPRYDALSAPQVHAWFDPSTKPGRMLDVGCGTGRDVAYFASLGWEAEGIDPVPAFVTQAKKNHPALKFEYGHAQDLLQRRMPTPYDLILFSASWQHVPPEVQDEIWEMLSKAAVRVVITVRHGPVPEGRGDFPVDVETLKLQGKRAGFAVEDLSGGDDQLGRSEVSWTVLSFVREFVMNFWVLED